MLVNREEVATFQAATFKTPVWDRRQGQSMKLGIQTESSREKGAESPRPHSNTENSGEH